MRLTLKNNERHQFHSWPSTQMINLIRQAIAQISYAVPMLLGISCAPHFALAEITSSGRSSVLKESVDQAVEEQCEGQRAGFIEVPFITNRAIDRGAIETQRKRHENFRYEAVFKNALGPGLSYGVVRVTYPLNRNVGDQTYSARSGEENAYNVFTFFNYRFTANEESLERAARSAYPRAFGERTLLYVHGMDNSFPEAVQRLAQLTVDMKATFVPIAFSWPSDVARSVPDRALFLPFPADYRKVHKVAEESVKSAVLGARIASQMGQHLHVLAHSMGAFVTAEALTGAQASEAVTDKSKAPPKMASIAFAAPDLSLERFRSQKLPKLNDLTKRITVYCGNDYALRMSEYIHGSARLGLCPQDPVVLKGVQTVKVTGAIEDRPRHSYFLNSKPVIENLTTRLFEVGPDPADGAENTVKPMLVDTGK